MNTTYYYALIGGLLIGVSTTMMMLWLGKITGISGIYSSLFQKAKRAHNWKYTFILGLVVGGFIVKSLNPSLFEYKMNFSILQASIAGILVGFGTRLGNGCTSGHGVCGMSRLSKRSIIATITFIFFGMLTVFIRRMIWGA